MRDRLKRSFGAIDKQRREAQTTLSSIADGMLAIDQQRQVTYINPVACRLLGVEQAEVAGAPIDSILRATGLNTGEPITCERIVESMGSKPAFAGYATQGCHLPKAPFDWVLGALPTGRLFGAQWGRATRECPTVHLWDTAGRA